MHGDHYVSTGMPKELERMKKSLEHKYTAKTEVLGPEEGQVKQLKILNRVLTWDGCRELIYEADPRHVEIIVRQLELEQSKAVGTPGTKEEGTTQLTMEHPLSSQQTSNYRALVARCDHLAPDRPDIAFSVKELARQMAAPTNGDWAKLKRLGRYLKGRPRLQQIYAWQTTPSSVTTCSDAGWARCKRSRKSTTGVCITVGSHVIKSWSKTQSLVALSSAESELYAILKASAETLGVLSMMKDLGYTLQGEVWGDASAAPGIINRHGLGKTRHVEPSLLWVQETAAKQHLKYAKVLGKDNPADLFAKYLDAATIDHHINKLQCKCGDGRADEAPKMHALSQSMEMHLNGQHHKECKWLGMVRTMGYIVEQHVEKQRDEREQASMGSISGPQNMHRSKRRVHVIQNGTRMERAPKGVSMHRHNNRSPTRGEARACNNDIVNSSVQSSHHAMRIVGPGRPVLQGYKRQVQGSNRLNPAQPCRPWGSTQIVPSEHNRTQRSCSDGRANARGVAHIPAVVSREGMIWLPSEKDQNCNAINEKEPRKEHREAGYNHYNYYYYYDTTTGKSSRSGGERHERFPCEMSVRGALLHRGCNS